MSSLAGWGRSTWGSGTWGIKVPVFVTGVEGTTALGSEEVTGVATVSVTGVEATGGLGTAPVVFGTTVIPTGVNATGVIGDVNIWALIDTSQTPNWVAISAP